MVYALRDDKPNRAGEHGWKAIKSEFGRPLSWTLKNQFNASPQVFVEPWSIRSLSVRKRVSPGGSSTINGVLYQMLWSLLRTTELYVTQCLKDAHSGEITKVILRLEPLQGGGDIPWLLEKVEHEHFALQHDAADALTILARIGGHCTVGNRARPFRVRFNCCFEHFVCIEE